MTQLLKTNNCLSGDARSERHAPVAEARRVALKATTSQNVEQILGQKMRSAFAEVLEEPVPQRFMDLLDELARTAQQ